MIQLTLTLKMTTAQVVEMSVTINNNSPIQDYAHLDDQTQLTFEMTPGFKPFTVLSMFSWCDWGIGIIHIVKTFLNLNCMLSYSPKIKCHFKYDTYNRDKIVETYLNT